jgi:hypothetical protein
MTSTKPPCEFITGEAGTGKSYLVQERVAADPKYGALCATTGVAAVNTGSITINSLLRYGMDYHALLDAYMTERLHRRLWQLDQTYQRIILDEAPMYSGRALDILYKALCERKLNLGLTLVGDFAQLPPINEPWIFQAKCWGRFAANTTRLTKNWRQEGGNFLTALNAIRVGDGGTGAGLLENCGVVFRPTRDDSFSGTTILSRNADVDRHNFVAHERVRGASVAVRSYRWGQQRPEWDPKKGLIPLEAEFRVGSYVMILTNDAPRFNYVNGDCGYVRDYNAATRKFSIELVRTGRVVEIGLVERQYTQREAPSPLPPGVVHVYCKCESPAKGGLDLSSLSGGAYEAAPPRRGFDPVWGTPSYNCPQDAWNIGAVRYYPLRLAYAATVWKTQGLTLDRVQVDFRNPFFSSPAALYVALSRCRTAEGLRLVGTPEQFVKRVQISKEAKEWI